MNKKLVCKSIFFNSTTNDTTIYDILLYLERKGQKQWRHSKLSDMASLKLYERVVVTMRIINFALGVEVHKGIFVNFVYSIPLY